LIIGLAQVPAHHRARICHTKMNEMG